MKKEYFFMAQVKNETIEVSAIASNKGEAHKKAKTALRKNFKKAKMLHLLRVEKLGKKEAKVKKDKKVVAKKKVAKKVKEVKEVKMAKKEELIVKGKETAKNAAAFVGGIIATVKAEVSKEENKAKVEKTKKAITEKATKAKEFVAEKAPLVKKNTKKAVKISRNFLSELFFKAAEAIEDKKE